MDTRLTAMRMEKGVETAMRKEIDELSRMTVGQLRQKYLGVFGEESRSNHKQFLFRRIAWRVQALAEGGLSERARRRALEIANDADLRIRAPSGRMWDLFARFGQCKISLLLMPRKRAPSDSSVERTVWNPSLSIPAREF